MTLNLLVGLTLLVAAAGVVLPLLPGVLLAVAALLVWAIYTPGAGAWGLFAAALAIIVAGQVLKYLIPGRTMSAAGVPGRSLVIGGLVGIVGFFAIPVVGLPIGFIGGVYVAEHVRLRDWPAAKASTITALKATGFSMLIELASILLAGSVWLAQVVGSAVV
ncbi:MAG: DUF456 domain-containing protein [Candidatus Nanopelagicales bacterium]